MTLVGNRAHTLVIFTSDNGAEPDWPARKKGHKTNGEFRGQKRTLHEGGHRVPFIARWPKKIAAGARSDVLICLTDMMAAFAAITGYHLSDAMGEDSYNVLPALLGEKKAIRTSILHHDIRGAMGIRHGKWKYMSKSGRVNHGEGKEGALYDMEKDWRETTNLYDSHPEVVKKLKAMLKKQHGDGRTAPARK
ncbi:MAG: sulfatase-like hydrolase/transferase [Phycisphaerae bacterium]|nr:sulfatase-like hydrolase/transferase [Phycisphaerae bacterium]